MGRIRDGRPWDIAIKHVMRSPRSLHVELRSIEAEPYLAFNRIRTEGGRDASDPHFAAGARNRPDGVVDCRFRSSDHARLEVGSRQVERREYSARSGPDRWE